MNKIEETKKERKRTRVADARVKSNAKVC